MSKLYREKTKTDIKITTKPEMRIHCQRPGKIDENGDIVYFTEQNHKNRCDVTKIIQKYSRTGLIEHVSKFEASFGDVSGLEFKEIQDKVLNAKKMFNELPSNIRKEFDNNPHKLLMFMDDENNREKAIKLGLINPLWTEETDGIGEHIKQGENKEKTIEEE